MEITTGQPNISVGGGYGDGFGFGGGSGLALLAFFAMMGFGGFGGGWGNRGPQVPNNVATTDTVNQAVQFSSLQDQNQNILSQIGQTQANMMQYVGDHYAELKDDIAANAVTLAQLQAHQNECCCQIRQEIAAQTLRQQEQFGALQMQTEQKFAALNERMYQNEIQGLRDQIQALRDQNFVQYPRGFSYNAGSNPFCGCSGLING